MPAKVIMLMHANGERDSNDGEKWCSSYTRGLALYEMINRGRFAYIYIFPYSSFTLLSSSFFFLSFIRFLPPYLDFVRWNSSTDRGNFQPV